MGYFPNLQQAAKQMLSLIKAVQHMLHHCHCVWDLQAEMLEEIVSLSHCSLQLGSFVHHKHNLQEVS